MASRAPAAPAGRLGSRLVQAPTVCLELSRRAAAARHRAGLLSFAIEMMDTLLMGKDILAMVVVVLADMVPLTIFQVAVYRLLLLGRAP